MDVFRIFKVFNKEFLNGNFKVPCSFRFFSSLTKLDINLRAELLFIVNVKKEENE